MIVIFIEQASYLGLGQVPGNQEVELWLIDVDASRDLTCSLTRPISMSHVH